MELKEIVLLVSYNSEEKELHCSDVRVPSDLGADDYHIGALLCMIGNDMIEGKTTRQDEQ